MSYVQNSFRIPATLVPIPTTNQLSKVQNCLTGIIVVIITSKEGTLLSGATLSKERTLLSGATRSKERILLSGGHELMFSSY